jgi:peptidoglycan/LPS O-acetylase OafA/YrhL
VNFVMESPGPARRLQSPAVAPGKFTQLEGLRGLAAAMVVVWHFIWAFAPWVLGSVAGSPAQGLVGNPVAAGIDGPAAVALFFVLSGFVIPLRFFRSGRAGMILRAAARRWPRLAGLSLLAVLFSYGLFRFGLFYFREAAVVTGSPWLGTYGGGAPGGALPISLARAVREGLVGAFVDKSDSYDPVLWTMRHELLGSFLSMGLALISRRRSARASGAIIALTGILAGVADPWLVPFVGGTGLALLFSRQQLRLNWMSATLSVAVGAFLFGYLEPTGAYSGMQVLQDSAGYRYDRIVVHTLAGLLLMTGIVGNPGVARALCVRPLRSLGRLSFPIYLFHFPLLCSLGCGLFLLLRPRLSYGGSITAVAIIYAAVVLSIGALLARVDELWGDWLNRVTDARRAAGVRGAGTPDGSAEDPFRTTRTATRPVYAFGPEKLGNV